MKSKIDTSGYLSFIIISYVVTNFAVKQKPDACLLGYTTKTWVFADTTTSKTLPKAVKENRRKFNFVCVLLYFKWVVIRSKKIQTVVFVPIWLKHNADTTMLFYFIQKVLKNMQMVWYGKSKNRDSLASIKCQNRDSLQDYSKPRLFAKYSRTRLNCKLTIPRLFANEKNITKNRISPAKRGSFARILKRKRDSIANWFGVAGALLLHAGENRRSPHRSVRL